MVDTVGRITASVVVGPRGGPADVAGTEVAGPDVTGTEVTGTEVAGTDGWTTVVVVLGVAHPLGTVARATPWNVPNAGLTST